MKRELDLSPDLWQAFDRVAEVRGSHEAALRYWLSAGGVFEPDVEYKKPKEFSFTHPLPLDAERRQEFERQRKGRK